MAYKRIQCKVLLTLFLIINTCFAGVVMEGDSLLVRENAHIEKLLMLDVTNEAMEADSILVKATDNYICNFPILKLPFFTESEIDSILLGKADTGHIHDTSDVTGLHDMLAGKSDVGHDHDTADVTNLSLYLGQKLDVTDTSDLARKIHNHTISNVTGLQDALALKLDISELDDYYTKTQLQTSGQSSVHWGNVTNAPSFITGVNWGEIGGDQSLVNVSGFNNDAGYLTALPSHDHDSRYYTKTNLQTSGQASVDAANIKNASWLKYAEYNVSVSNTIFWTVLDVDGDPVISKSDRVVYKISLITTGSGTRTGDVYLLHNPDGEGWEVSVSSKTGNGSNYPYVFIDNDVPKVRTDHSSEYTVKAYIEQMETGNNSARGTILGPWYNFASSIGNAIYRDHNGVEYSIWYEGNLDPSDYALVSQLDNYYTKANLQTSGQASVHWGNLTNKPSVFPPASHNHSATDINSGTLSNSRLSFNPDYFVQGTSSRRSVPFDVSNSLDDSLYSTFFLLRSDDPSSPSSNALYGFRAVHPFDDDNTTEIAGRAQTGELLFGGLHGGTRQPWREIWHNGNLDTANIARRNADNVFTGVNTFDDTVGIKNGIKISDNSNHFFMIGPDLYGEAGNELPSIKFYLKDYWSEYPHSSEQSIKLEADWIRNLADYRISNSAKEIGNSGLSIFSDDHIGGGVANPVYIRNNYSIDSTGAQITFGFDHSITSDYHHAGIKAVRTNKGADHASSIYLQARVPGTSAGPSGLTDIVEAGINDHQAFVKYHNNPPVIHSPDSLIFVNTPLTFNPHRGSYAAYSGNPPQTMTLGSGEPGQTVEFCIVDGTFPLTIVYEGGYVETEYGKIYKFKYIESLGWFKYE